MFKNITNHLFVLCVTLPHKNNNGRTTTTNRGSSALPWEDKDKFHPDGAKHSLGKIYAKCRTDFQSGRRLKQLRLWRKRRLWSLENRNDIGGFVWASSWSPVSWGTTYGIVYTPSPAGQPSPCSPAPRPRCTCCHVHVLHFVSLNFNLNIVWSEAKFIVTEVHLEGVLELKLRVVPCIGHFETPGDAWPWNAMATDDHSVFLPQFTSASVTLLSCRWPRPGDFETQWGRSSW